MRAANSKPGSVFSTAKSVARSGVSRSARQAGKWEIDFERKKFFVADERGDYSPDTTSALPESYGVSRVVALVRNPCEIYVYWEFARKDVKTAIESLGKGSGQIHWVLRLLEGAKNDSDGSTILEAQIDPYRSHELLRVDMEQKECVVDIGLTDDDGRFVRIARSNTVFVPGRAPLCSPAEGEWAVSDEVFDKLYELSTGAKPGMTPAGSSDLFSDSLASGSGAGFGSFDETVKSPDRGFFFRLDCELVVYGATEPDALVTMFGEKIKLNPDGTFSARFALPDGARDIPVVATSADQLESRQISPSVARSTRVSRVLHNSRAYTDRFEG